MAKTDITWRSLQEGVKKALNTQYPPDIQTDNEGQLIIYTGLYEVPDQDELDDEPQPQPE